jgi:hypothetical protein
MCLIFLQTNGQQQIDTLQYQLNDFYKRIPQERLFVTMNNDELAVDIFKQEFYEQKHFKDSLINNKMIINQQDIGLHFRSNAKYNLLKNSLPNSDDFLRSRVNISAGLEWDVLKYGWRDRKVKAKQLQTELEIEQLTQEFKKDQQNYLHRYHYTHFIFNQFLLEELQFHGQLYNEQIALYMDMYYLNLLPYSDIIALKQRQKEIAVKINEIERATEVSTYSSDYEQGQFPFFDLNLKEIVQTFQGNHLADTIANKQKQHLQSAYELKNEMTFGVYTHLQLFKSATAEEWMVSPVVGVNLSVPLFKNKRQEFKSLGFEKQIIDEKLNVQKDNELKAIYQLYSIYQDQLKSVKGLYYRLYFEKEKLQTALIKKQKAEQSSIISTFSHLNNMLEIRREVTMVKQQMYLVALEIFTTVGTEHLKVNSPMIELIEWEDIRPSTVAVILNANKDMTDIQFFIQYMKRKNINKIHLTGGGGSYKLTKELLEYEGFELLQEVEASSIIQVEDFTVLKDLKTVIHQPGKLIVLRDLHELLAFEMQTFKPDKDQIFAAPRK